MTKPAFIFAFFTPFAALLATAAWCPTAVAAEPLRESAQRALITAHLAEGNQGEAIRQYRQFQHHLSVELGVQPSIDLQELMRGYVGEPAP